ncbi:WD40 repeat-like protein [Clavulina sp. PMI_390]|nr:WD40 repeat-like protein [Clavulina sp. PMI_390]
MAGDAFFSKPNKRKRASSSGNRSGPVKKSLKRAGTKTPKQAAASTSARSRKRDEELDSQHSASEDDMGANIDDLDLRESDIDENASGEEDESETAAQKRLRLAKLYLQSVQDELGDGDVDAADLDRELINSRLRQDVLQHAGKIHLFLADSIPTSTKNSPNPPSLRLKGHRFSITSAVASESGQTLFTSGKEGSIIKWELLSGKRLATFPKVRPASQSDRKGKGKMSAEAHAANEVQGHLDEVLTLALSSDGKYLASGGKDRRLGVWDAQEGKWVRSFGGHRDIISSLSFRKGSHTLYTASYDRTLKSFDLAAMGYVETLFGHQDPVTCIDSLRGETAISAGGQDRSVRYWKIVDETQLVFRGGGRSKLREMLESGGIDEEEKPKEVATTDSFVEGRIDAVAMLDESTFVSGGDTGTVSLWSTSKKKPLFSYPMAHGVTDQPLDPSTSSSFGSKVTSIRNARWITAVGALPYSDIFATGSWDGQIRIWKLDVPSSSNPLAKSSSSQQFRSFSPLRSISVPGVINSIQLVRPPAGAMSNATWLSGSQNASATPASKAQDILLVAGVGQEPRLGRWVTVKDNGVKNATYVFALTRSVATSGEGLGTSGGDVDEEDMDE